MGMRGAVFVSSVGFATISNMIVKLAANRFTVRSLSTVHFLCGLCCCERFMNKVFRLCSLIILLNSVKFANMAYKAWLSFAKTIN